MTESISEKASKEQRFVEHLIQSVQTRPAERGAWRRADNPDTEHICWEHLANWCDLENARDRIAFATIGAAIAKTMPRANGSMPFGQALAASYENGNQNDSAKMKLRRLTAASTQLEACRLVRPLLSYISSRGKPIDYVGTLRGLRFFGEKTKLQWASQFYYKGGGV